MIKGYKHLGGVIEMADWGMGSGDPQRKIRGMKSFFVGSGGGANFFLTAGFINSGIFYVLGFEC